MSPIKSNPLFVTFMLGIAAIAAIAAIVTHPAQAYSASIEGLHLWWNIVFPALLPYYILCEILIAYGVVRLIGRGLNPVASLWFRLPSLSGHALAAGLLNGSSSGAEITVRLRKEGRISRMQAERIVMTAYFANPIFLITIAGVALLHSSNLGLFLAAVHYSSLFLCGLVIRYYGSGSKERGDMPVSAPDDGVPIQQSSRSFGTILGDSVTGSLQKLLQIGGTIMVFSVFIRLSDELGITGAAIGIVKPFVSAWIPSNTYRPVLAGLLESHIGAWTIARTTSLPPGAVLALICAIAAWGGFAVHLQVRATLHKTDIRYAPYLFARLMQSIIAFIVADLLWEPWMRLFPSAMPSLGQLDPALCGPPPGNPTLWPYQMPTGNTLAVVIALLVALLAFRQFDRR